MIILPLQAVPNQNFSFQDNDTQVNYFISIKTCGTNTAEIQAQVMTFDISINDVLVVSGCRAVAGFPLLASKYQENGNFVVLTANDDLPDYTKFGISQYLLYANQLEIDQIIADANAVLLDIEALT